MSQLKKQIANFQNSIQKLAVEAQLQRLRPCFHLMTEDQSNRYSDMFFDQPATPFTETEILELEEKLALTEAENILLNKVSLLNSKGMEAEKSGSVEEAVNFYEENIKLGYRATHSFNRLMIIYRREKRYDEEIRVIENAKQVFDGQPDFIDGLNKRLIKAKQLQQRKQF